MNIKHFMLSRKQEIIFAVLYAAAFSLLLTGISRFCKNQQYSQESPAQIQENIAQNIVRLHVIANSDTDADQRLKLAVRDEIITSLQSALKNAQTVSEASEIITAHYTQIQTTAETVIAQYGASYPVNVSLQARYFPVKQYGDLTFPAGTYQALCVEIGEAAGRNWWCVLFPSLCFVNETTATVPEDSKDKLKDCLSEEEYQSISENSQNADEKPEIHFGIAEWFQNTFK